MADPEANGNASSGGAEPLDEHPVLVIQEEENEAEDQINEEEIEDHDAVGDAIEEEEELVPEHFIIQVREAMGRDLTPEEKIMIDQAVDTVNECREEGSPKTNTLALLSVCFIPPEYAEGSTQQQREGSLLVLMQGKEVLQNQEILECVVESLRENEMRHREEEKKRIAMKKEIIQRSILEKMERLSVEDGRERTPRKVGRRDTYFLRASEVRREEISDPSRDIEAGKTSARQIISEKLMDRYRIPQAEPSLLGDDYPILDLTPKLQPRPRITGEGEVYTDPFDARYGLSSGSSPVKAGKSFQASLKRPKISGDLDGEGMRILRDPKYQNPTAKEIAMVEKALAPLKAKPPEKIDIFTLNADNAKESLHDIATQYEVTLSENPYTQLCMSHTQAMYGRPQSESAQGQIEDLMKAEEFFRSQDELYSPDAKESEIRKAICCVNMMYVAITTHQKRQADKIELHRLGLADVPINRMIVLISSARSKIQPSIFSLKVSSLESMDDVRKLLDFEKKLQMNLLKHKSTAEEIATSLRLEVGQMVKYHQVEVDHRRIIELLKLTLIAGGSDYMILSNLANITSMSLPDPSNLEEYLQAFVDKHNEILINGEKKRSTGGDSKIAQTSAMGQEKARQAAQTEVKSDSSGEPIAMMEKMMEMMQKLESFKPQSFKPQWKQQSYGGPSSAKQTSSADVGERPPYPMTGGDRDTRYPAYTGGGDVPMVIDGVMQCPAKHPNCNARYCKNLQEWPNKAYLRWWVGRQRARKRMNRKHSEIPDSIDNFLRDDLPEVDVVVSSTPMPGGGSGSAAQRYLYARETFKLADLTETSEVVQINSRLCTESRPDIAHLRRAYVMDDSKARSQLIKSRVQSSFDATKGFPGEGPRSLMSESAIKLVTEGNQFCSREVKSIRAPARQTRVDKTIAPITQDKVHDIEKFQRVTGRRSSDNNYCPLYLETLAGLEKKSMLRNNPFVCESVTKLQTAGREDQSILVSADQRKYQRRLVSDFSETVGQGWRLLTATGQEKVTKVMNTKEGKKGFSLHPEMPLSSAVRDLKKAAEVNFSCNEHLNPEDVVIAMVAFFKGDIWETFLLGIDENEKEKARSTLKFFTAETDGCVRPRDETRLPLEDFWTAVKLNLDLLTVLDAEWATWMRAQIAGSATWSQILIPCYSTQDLGKVMQWTAQTISQSHYDFGRSRALALFAQFDIASSYDDSQMHHEEPEEPDGRLTHATQWNETKLSDVGDTKQPSGKSEKPSGRYGPENDRLVMDVEHRLMREASSMFKFYGKTTPRTDKSACQESMTDMSECRGGWPELKSGEDSFQTVYESHYNMADIKFYSRKPEAAVSLPQASLPQVNTQPFLVLVEHRCVGMCEKEQEVGMVVRKDLKEQQEAATSVQESIQASILSEAADKERRIRTLKNSVRTFVKMSREIQTQIGEEPVLHVNSETKLTRITAFEVAGDGDCLPSTLATLMCRGDESEFHQRLANLRQMMESHDTRTWNFLEDHEPYQRLLKHDETTPFVTLKTLTSTAVRELMNLAVILSWDKSDYKALLIDWFAQTLADPDSKAPEKEFKRSIVQICATQSYDKVLYKLQTGIQQELFDYVQSAIRTIFDTTKEDYSLLTYEMMLAYVKHMGTKGVYCESQELHAAVDFLVGGPIWLVCFDKTGKWLPSMSARYIAKVHGGGERVVQTIHEGARPGDKLVLLFNAERPHYDGAWIETSRVHPLVNWLKDVPHIDWQKDTPHPNGYEETHCVVNKAQPAETENEDMSHAGAYLDVVEQSDVSDDVDKNKSDADKNGPDAIGLSGGVAEQNDVMDFLNIEDESDADVDLSQDVPDKGGEKQLGVPETDGGSRKRKSLTEGAPAGGRKKKCRNRRKVQHEQGGEKLHVGAIRDRPYVSLLPHGVVPSSAREGMRQVMVLRRVTAIGEAADGHLPTWEVMSFGCRFSHWVTWCTDLTSPANKDKRTKLLTSINQHLCKIGQRLDEDGRTIHSESNSVLKPGVNSVQPCSHVFNLSNPDEPHSFFNPAGYLPNLTPWSNTKELIESFSHAAHSVSHPIAVSKQCSRLIPTITVNMEAPPTPLSVQPRYTVAWSLPTQESCPNLTFVVFREGIEVLRVEEVAIIDEILQGGAEFMERKLNAYSTESRWHTVPTRKRSARAGPVVSLEKPLDEQSVVVVSQTPVTENCMLESSTTSQLRSGKVPPGAACSSSTLSGQSLIDTPTDVLEAEQQGDKNILMSNTSITTVPCTENNTLESSTTSQLRSGKVPPGAECSSSTLSGQSLIDVSDERVIAVTPAVHLLDEEAVMKLLSKRKKRFTPSQIARLGMLRALNQKACLDNKSDSDSHSEVPGTVESATDSDNAETFDLTTGVNWVSLEGEAQDSSEEEGRNRQQMHLHARRTKFFNAQHKKTVSGRPRTGFYGAQNGALASSDGETCLQRLVTTGPYHAGYQNMPFLMDTGAMFTSSRYYQNGKGKEKNTVAVYGVTSDKPLPCLVQPSQKVRFRHTGMCHGTPQSQGWSEMDLHRVLVDDRFDVNLFSGFSGVKESGMTIVLSPLGSFVIHEPVIPNFTPVRDDGKYYQIPLREHTRGWWLDCYVTEGSDDDQHELFRPERHAT